MPIIIRVTELVTAYSGLPEPPARSRLESGTRICALFQLLTSYGPGSFAQTDARQICPHPATCHFMLRGLSSDHERTNIRLLGVFRSMCLPHKANSSFEVPHHNEADIGRNEGDATPTPASYTLASIVGLQCGSEIYRRNRKAIRL